MDPAPQSHEQYWKDTLWPACWTDSYDLLFVFVHHHLTRVLLLFSSATRELDHILTNELSPEALASINKVIHKLKLDHNTDFTQLMCDWGLGATETEPESTCPTFLDGEHKEDSSERLRSLLHFLYESSIYRDLSFTSGAMNLIPLVTIKKCEALLNNSIAKALETSKVEDRT
jgi:hypothetical protein